MTAFAELDAHNPQWMDRLPQILPALFLQASIRICRLCIRRDVSRGLPEVPLRRETNLQADNLAR